MDDNVDAPQIVVIPKVGILRRAGGVIATVLAVLYTALLAVPVALASLFGNGHFATPVIKLWSWAIYHTCGISVEIEGLENLEGVPAFVLVSNHQSLFDIVAVLHLIPREMRFVAKRELKKIPVIGFALERSENIVIDRERGGKAIRRALEVARHGYSICVFAEGHRFSDNRVHEFNDGAAWLAIATRLPCVPLAISGTAALMPRKAKFVIPGRRIRFALGRPISTEGMRSADRLELTRRLEAEVRAAFRGEV
jgi:1-acyl-sn-glycerol-3-phosphate acyltransferase